MIGSTEIPPDTTPPGFSASKKLRDSALNAAVRNSAASSYNSLFAHQIGLLNSIVYMKHLLPIVGLALTLASPARSGPQSPDQSSSSASAAIKAPAIPVRPGDDQENARKARALLEQAIQALGGQAYLNIRDMQQQGRIYGFHHGRPSGTGSLFWRFVQYPDKERLEVTKERDVATVYTGDKGYEVTYKGPHAVEKKDLEDYLRRRRFSLETMLRVWINDPTVALFYDGNALAGNLAAQQVTLINAKNEAVSLYFDVDTHLPLKKSYQWRDPVDKERNTEEEIYDNYKPVQGVMTYHSFTRYYNGDMQSQRFINSVQFNQGLNPAMFDPNSGYDPNKATKKR